VWATAGLREKFESLLVTGTVPPEEDDMGYFAENHGVKPIVIPQMSREISLKDAFTIWKLFRLFLSERPDIVHTHTAKAGTAGRVAGILYKWFTPSILIGRPRRCQPWLGCRREFRQTGGPDRDRHTGFTSSGQREEGG